MSPITVRRGRAAVQRLEIVRLAQHPVLVQGEFLPGGQLAVAGGTGEARQMVDVVARLPHPIAGRDAAGAHRTLCPKTSETFAEILNICTHEERSVLFNSIMGVGILCAPFIIRTQYPSSTQTMSYV